MKSGSKQKYETLTLEDLCDLPIKEIADKEGSVLFLWTTTPLKMEATEVLKAWGFEYKTTIYWRKIMSLGMGFWYRGQVEECWLAIRGKVKAFRCQVPNFIQSKVRKHSKKPEELFQLIEPPIDKYDLNPKIELFATEKRDGWYAEGYEINGEDIRDVLKNIIGD